MADNPGNYCPVAHVLTVEAVLGESQPIGRQGVKNAARAQPAGLDPSRIKIRVSDAGAGNRGSPDACAQPEPVREPVPPPVLPYLATALLKAALLLKNRVAPVLELMVRKNRKSP